MNEDIGTRWRRMPYEDRMIVILGLMAIVAILLFGIGYKLGVMHIEAWALDQVANCIYVDIPYV